MNKKSQNVHAVSNTLTEMEDNMFSKKILIFKNYSAEVFHLFVLPQLARIYDGDCISPMYGINLS